MSPATGGRPPHPGLLRVPMARRLGNPQSALHTPGGVNRIERYAGLALRHA